MDASHFTIFFLGISAGGFCCLLIVIWARRAAQSITEALRRARQEKAEENLVSPDDLLEVIYHEEYLPPAEKCQPKINFDCQGALKALGKTEKLLKPDQTEEIEVSPEDVLGTIYPEEHPPPPLEKGQHALGQK